MQDKLPIQSLRSLFQSNELDGYIIPSTDEYQNEYTPIIYKRLQYVTGFTGSNGILVALKDKALFFTDGRYFNQASKELESSIFTVHDISTIKDTKISGTLGYDSALFTEETIGVFKHCSLKQIDKNLVDEIWTGRPQYQASTAFLYPLAFSGEGAEAKVSKCREVMVKHAANYLCITSVDSVCWLLNIRASDVVFSPVILCYCIVGMQKVWLFTDNTNVRNVSLPSDVEVLPIRELYNFLNTADGKMIVDQQSCPLSITQRVKDKVYLSDPCKMFKACKNDTEIKCSADVHIRDAVAVCETIAWIHDMVGNGSVITEYDVGLKLAEWRCRQDGYISESFSPIVGYQDNGAIIHYSARVESAKTIAGNGLLLIDSGGHYFGGTTDITRTIAIGVPNHEHKRRYTQVLKGHLGLMMQKFPKNISGAHLDVLARMHLWNDHIDYPHGTGHGVGNALYVHEGPQRISKYAHNTALQSGMIVSNEPGFYVPGEYGIRIENLMYVSECDNKNFLRFYNLTVVPYCIELIDFALLSNDEIEYITIYHKYILSILGDRLSTYARRFVENNIIKI